MRHRGSPRCRRLSRCRSRVATPRLVVRRYLPCLRHRISDTDSDDIPLGDVLSLATSEAQNMEPNACATEFHADQDEGAVTEASDTSRSTALNASALDRFPPVSAPCVMPREPVDGSREHFTLCCASLQNMSSPQQSTIHGEVLREPSAFNMNTLSHDSRALWPLPVTPLQVPLNMHTESHDCLTNHSAPLNKSLTDQIASSHGSYVVHGTSSCEPSQILMTPSCESAEAHSSVRARETSVLHSALPLFRDHFRLPSFTGRRRWHAMFGQFQEPNNYAVNDADLTLSDDDILADSNLDSLFDSTDAPPLVNDYRPVQSTQNDASNLENVRQRSQAIDSTSRLPSLEILQNDIGQLLNSFMSPPSDYTCQLLDCDLTIDSNAVTVPQFSAINLAAALSSVLPDNRRTCCEEPAAASCIPISVEETQSNSLRRRHSAPSSSRSSTVGSCSGSRPSSRLGSRSGSSSQGSWYFYDRRLRPGGALASFYSRARIRRSLSAIVFPPAYDDIIAQRDAVDTMALLWSDTGASMDNSIPLPPPSTVDDATYATDLPPPYVANVDDINSGGAAQVTSNQVMPEQTQPPSYAEAVHEMWPASVLPLSAVQQSVCSNTAAAAVAATADLQQFVYSVSAPPVDRILPMRCVSNPSGAGPVFGSRPAVRWNRNMRVERWTSSANWVSS